MFLSGELRPRPRQPDRADPGGGIRPDIPHCPGCRSTKFSIPLKGWNFPVGVSSPALFGFMIAVRVGASGSKHEDVLNAIPTEMSCPE